MLCEDCSAVEITQAATGVVIREYDSFTALESSAAQGCDLCSLVRHSHQEAHAQSERRYTTATDTRNRGHVKHSSISVFYDIHSTDLETNLHWRCYEDWKGGSNSLAGALGGFYADDNSPAAVEVVGRQVPSDPMSAGSMKTAGTWLRDCISSHADCPDARLTYLPTRVIDVGEETSSEQLRLLHPPKGMLSRYIALSYCWGNAKEGILTLDNMESRRLGFPLNGQPKTIRDAVFVTRELGLQYLWVDSLCIVQDSREDWERESATMCDVYSNAHLTIQASRATRSTEGFLHCRTEPTVRPAELRYRTRAGTTGSVFVRPRLLVDPTVTESLHGRGWTYQEALLSPRILSFGATQSSWECKKCFASEGGSSLAVTESFAGLPKPIRRKAPPTFLPQNLSLGSAQIMRRLTWSYMIMEYSERTLSFGQDKLQALAGLARLIETTRPSDKYLAGLWRNDLPEDLMWGPQDDAARSSEYRAPTWSWASVDGRIASFHENFGKEAKFCKVLDARVTLSGLDTFGAVRAASLKLRSVVKIGWRILDQRTLAGDTNVQFFYSSPQVPGPGDNTFQLKLGLCQLDITDRSQRLDRPMQNHYMRIFEDAGLVLREIAHGCFERVGIFYLDRAQELWFDSCVEQGIELV